MEEGRERQTYRQADRWTDRQKQLIVREKEKKNEKAREKARALCEHTPPFLDTSRASGQGA